MGERYHFVCHECAEEGVYGDHSEAITVKESHVRRTGHRVSLSNIESQVA